MNEIRISGDNPKDLKKAILFVLENTNNRKSFDQPNINSMEVHSDHIIANAYYNDIFERYSEYKKNKLPIALTQEAFADSVVEWFKTANPREKQDSYFDGTIKKGFIVMTGRDWGEFAPGTDFGYTGYDSNRNKNSIVEMKHNDIYVFVNWQMYGK